MIFDNFTEPSCIPYERNQDGWELRLESKGAGKSYAHAVELLHCTAMPVATSVEFKTETGGRNGRIGHLLEKCRSFARCDDPYVGHVIQLAIQLDEIVRT